MTYTLLLPHKKKISKTNSEQRGELRKQRKKGSKVMLSESVFYSLLNTFIQAQNRGVFVFRRSGSRDIYRQIYLS